MRRLWSGPRTARRRPHCPKEAIHAFLELHIEKQGRVLESAGEDVAIVDRIVLP